MKLRHAFFPENIPTLSQKSSLKNRGTPLSSVTHVPAPKKMTSPGWKDPTCNRWVWPSPKSRRPLTSEKFCLGIWIWKKKDVPPKKLKNCLVHPWDFHILISWIFGRISNLEFPSSHFQVPAVELWGCIDSHYPQVEVPFLFLVRELIILQNNV